MSSIGLFNIINDTLQSINSDDEYTAKVVSFNEKEFYNSEKDIHYKMYQPIIEFKTNSNEVIKTTLDFHKSKINIGDVYKISYNKQYNKIITLGFPLIIQIIGYFIFTFILGFLTIGILNYCLGNSMQGYISVITIVGFYFFIPF